MTEIIESLEAARRATSRSVMTIGNFDGMHIGHQAIFAQAIDEAKERGVKSLALTFEPHPKSFFQPEKAPLRLAPVPYKFDLMAQYGIDQIVALPFNWALAGQRPEEFVEEILIQALGAELVVVGEDFRFGKKRAGDVDSLKRIGAHHKMDARGAERITWDGEVVSSSRVRNAIFHGELEAAEAMLGRPYQLFGEVIHGDARGRDLGYPTANLDASGMAIPPDGIYVTTLARRGEKHLKAATSIGVRPTFGGGERTIETYVLDEEVPDEGLDLYGSEIELAFRKYLRKELKFDSSEALVAQMDQDIAQTRAFFQSHE